MAFNWQTFRTRTLTAILFVLIMAAGLFWNRWSFFILFSIIHFGCWIEYGRLVGVFHPPYQKISAFHRYGVMVAGWCLMLFYTNDALGVGGFRLKELGLWMGGAFLFLLPLSELLRLKIFSFTSMAYSLSGLMYVSLPLALITDLRNHWSEASYQLNLTVPLLVVFTLWVNDTMAYLVGSFIGKTQLSSISPKKTWEGTIGGIVLAVGLMMLAAYFTGRLSPLHTAILTLIVTIAGTFGDLFQSKLKRMAGVKDSGQIMPGHGGFLDRFDSLLIASTFAWMYAVAVL